MKKIDEINDIDELIIDYITGRLSPEKFNLLNSWIAESEENNLYFRKLQEIWYATAPQNEVAFDKGLAYNRFLYRIKEFNKSEPVIPRNKIIFNKRFIQVAASVAIILVLGSIYFLKILSPSGTSKDEFYSITVPYGAKSKVTLSDSTKVWLNSGTTIKYSYIAKDKLRKLTLKGEAYFEVAKMKGVPFIVETDRLVVKVLGTKFNVVSYSEDSNINVTLLEGSIALKMDNDKNKEIRLVPNKSATFDKSSNILEVKDVDASMSNQWSQGTIIFDDEKLEQIAHRLEREYNVKIDISNAILIDSRFYGVFSKKQSIKEIFDIITLNNKLHYRISRDSIKVSTTSKFN
jgi:ferric-dicitrate binding protein FerR (iron transport regulator)